MAEGNKRPPSARSRWIWTGILAVPVVAIVAATVYLSQQPLGRPPATPPPAAQTDEKYTDFGTAGLEYATSARFVSVNATDLPIAASDIGLGPDQTATIEASNLGNTLRLTVGGDLVDLYPVGEISVSASGGQVTEVTYSTSGGVADARRALLDDVSSFGLPKDQVAPLVATIKQRQREGDGYSVALEPGTDLGVTVTPSIDCDPTGFCVLTHTVDLRG